MPQMEVTSPAMSNQQEVLARSQLRYRIGGTSYFGVSCEAELRRLRFAPEGSTVQACVTHMGNKIPTSIRLISPRNN
jgi:hypothetical protein